MRKSSSLLVFLLLLAAPATAQRPSRAGKLQRLTQRTWAWVSNLDSSANGALFVGRDAALLVDPGRTPKIARRFFAAARGVTDRPIRWVVLTHWHKDHALGLCGMASRDFKLLAHPFTRRILAERGARMLASLGESRGLSVRRLLADEVVSGQREIDLGDHVVELRHLGPAHTRGDLVVWSPAEKVLVTGDLFLRDSCPDLGSLGVASWIASLDRLAELDPEHVVPGHFAPGGRKEMQRFRAYLAALEQRVGKALADGVSAEAVGRRVQMSEFADFRQIPRYRATFEGNARALARALAQAPPKRGKSAVFRLRANLELGRAPHQIAFSRDGSRAFVAVAGSNRVVPVEVASLKALASIEIEGTPLGVAELPGGAGLAVARFAGNSIVRIPSGGTEPTAELTIGKGPSLLVGPYPGGRYLVSVERANRMVVLNGKGFAIEAGYPTGKRPFPPAATADGRLAFVPNYDDGTVTVVDLWNRRVLDQVEVGPHPSGGVVLPGDQEYAVAVRGANRIVFLNTASHRIVSSLEAGIGTSPFSVVSSPDGRFLFVNNTQSHDVSIIALPERRVIARVPVGEVPIVMAAHPSSRSLWVSCEGSHVVSVLELPAAPAPVARRPQGKTEGKTEVFVLGMIHGRHRTSRSWGIEQLRETLTRLHPDVICCEIPPDRWQRIWSDYAERGVIEDPRVKLFPEYTDVLLPLKVEQGFVVEPCAGWNTEMALLRRRRLKEFSTVAKWRQKYRTYTEATAKAQAGATLMASDDPSVIHSVRYDEQVEAVESIYDEFLNDFIGPGGWSHINAAHLRLIEAALDRHKGQRVVIMFGAGHKYKILEKLRGRADVELRDVRKFLGPR